MSKTVLRKFFFILCHIKDYKLFNAKSCLDLYIKYTWCVNIFLITLLNKLELIYLQLNDFKYFYVI